MASLWLLFGSLLSAAMAFSIGVQAQSMRDLSDCGLAYDHPERQIAACRALIAHGGSENDLAGYRNNLMLALAFSGDHAEALSLAETLTAAQPDDHILWSNTGLVHCFAGDRSAAIRAHLKAIEVEPSHVVRLQQALNQHGYETELSRQAVERSLIAWIDDGCPPASNSN